MTSKTQTSSTSTTCQICGRPVKSGKGVIAHHGYKRPGNGWQTASCYGARKAPYEVSCDAIPGAIARAESYIESTTALIADLKQNPPETIKAQRYVGMKGYQPITVERPEGFVYDTSRRSYRINAYDTELYKKVADLESGIRFAQIDVKFLNERLANWKAPEQANV
jgi:hypothetical protein